MACGISLCSQYGTSFAKPPLEKESSNLNVYQPVKWINIIFSQRAHFCWVWLQQRLLQSGVYRQHGSEYGRHISLQPILSRVRPIMNKQPNQDILSAKWPNSSWIVVQFLVSTCSAGCQLFISSNLHVHTHVWEIVHSHSCLNANLIWDQPYLFSCCCGLKERRKKRFHSCCFLIETICYFLSPLKKL